MKDLATGVEGEEEEEVVLAEMIVIGTIKKIITGEEKDSMSKENLIIEMITVLNYVILN